MEQFFFTGTQCEEDDTFTGASLTLFGGRSFLGLGSLLTGAEVS